MGGGRAGQACGQEGCPSRSRGFCSSWFTLPLPGPLALFCLDEARATCKCPTCPQFPTPTKGPELRLRPAPPKDFPVRKQRQVEVHPCPQLSLVWPLAAPPPTSLACWPPQLWGPSRKERAAAGPHPGRKRRLPTGPGQRGLLAALAVAPSWSCHPGHNH